MQQWYELVLQQKHLVWNVFLQHWYGLCYNTNSWSEMFLTTLVWLVLQHKQLFWTVSCNIGMTCITTQSVALNCFLQHWYDLCYNTNSCFELFLATLVWLVLQHKQLLWIVSCNIGMTCVTTQTVALNCFLQHWYDLCYNTNTVALNCFLQHSYDLCYNTNSCFVMFLATLVWLVLQHKQLLWTVSCNIGMACVTTQKVSLKCFLQHWYDLCYNTNSWSELFLATLVWLVLQHKTVGSELFLVTMVWLVLQYKTVGSELFLATLVWLVLQHKQLLWIVLLATLVWLVLQHKQLQFELFLATLVWLVLQHKQLLWTVSCNIGMTCVTTQTVALKCFLQHRYDLCYNTNCCFELFLATLVWLVLQHNQLLWNVSFNIGMTCVTTQTVALNCFLQLWYDLCYNTNSFFELFLTTLVWLVLQHIQRVWIVSYNIGMTCDTPQTVGSALFLATLVWLVLQHKQLLWNVSCNIGMTCVTTHTVALKCFLATLVRLVLQHKQLLWNVSCNIGMAYVTKQSVAFKWFFQNWYDLCYNTNSCFELFLATLVWLVLQHKLLVWIVSYNIDMTSGTTQTVGLNCFLQHWYDLCYNTNSWVWIVSCNNGMACVTT